MSAMFKVTAKAIEEKPGETLRAWIIVRAESPKDARTIARPSLSADFFGHPFRIVRTERRRNTNGNNR